MRDRYDFRARHRPIITANAMTISNRMILLFTKGEIMLTVVWAIFTIVSREVLSSIEVNSSLAQMVNGTSYPRLSEAYRDDMHAVYRSTRPFFILDAE